MTDVNIFLLVDLNNEYFTKNILKDVFEWLSLTWQFLLQLLLVHGDFRKQVFHMEI